MRISDWSSDVCSSDLPGQRGDFRVDLVDFEQGKLTDVGAGCRGAGPEGQQAVDILERKASLLGTLDKSDAPNRFLFEASIPVRIAASRYDQSFTFIVTQRLDGDATLACDTPDVHGIYRLLDPT